MCDKLCVLLLAGGSFVYNYIVGGPPPISPELIFTSVFGYLTGSAIGYAKGKNGSGTHPV